MEIDVLDKKGTRISSLNLAEGVFEGEVREHLFYEVVKMQLAGRRRGTACTKTRGEVRGGGAKPWRQKGSGRARAGTIRSPLWRHGGTVFGPKPRDYSYSVPSRVRKEALKSALRLKLRDSALKIIDTLEIDEPKTKKALEFLNGLGLKSALVVIDQGEKNLALGLRNLKDFKTIKLGGINIFDILNYENLVMTGATLEKVEAMLG
ncbi:MAG: 50S ribosomal protein L4 [Thermodesulfobacteriota bacterium]|nr:MAG: 50S ribosomal protein L4 [Thermodesulfobacteriota bacterium]